MLKCKLCVAFAAALAATSSFAEVGDIDVCSELPAGSPTDHWCLFDSFGTGGEDNSGTQFALWLTPTPTSAAPNPAKSTESSNGSIVGVMRIPEAILTTGQQDGTLCPVSGDYVNLGEIGGTGGVYEYRVGLFSNCWCGDGANPAKRTFVLDVDEDGPVDDQIAENLDAHSFRCDASTDVTLGAQIGPLVTPPGIASSTPTTTPDVITVPGGFF